MQRGVCKAGNCEVPFAVFGSGARTMLLLNGAQQTRAAWRSVIKRFSNCYRIVTFDPPGQGSAANLSTKHFSLADHVEVASAVVKTAAPTASLMSSIPQIVQITSLPPCLISTAKRSPSSPTKLLGATLNKRYRYDKRIWFTLPLAGKKLILDNKTLFIASD